MTVFYLALAIVSGLCMAFQSPTNATLSRYTGNLQATCVSFGGGAVCLLILMLAIGTGDITHVVNAEWWQLLGGVYGVCIVLAITFAMPRLGAAVLLIATMLGQLTGGTLVDTFGPLKTNKIKLNSWRYAGLAVIALGVVIVAITKM